MSVAMKHAHGNTTLLESQIREGCVVRPLVERKSFRGNRVIVKVVSEKYLLRGKELNGEQPTEYS